MRSTLAVTYSQESSVSQSDALNAVDRLASDIPRFQVAVPDRLDEWDPANYTPLVAYVPEGVEDTTLETVRAYDALGTAHQTTPHGLINQTFNSKRSSVLIPCLQGKADVSDDTYEVTKKTDPANTTA